MASSFAEKFPSQLSDTRRGQSKSRMQSAAKIDKTVTLRVSRDAILA